MRDLIFLVVSYIIVVGTGIALVPYVIRMSTNAQLEEHRYEPQPFFRRRPAARHRL